MIIDLLIRHKILLALLILIIVVIGYFARQFIFKTPTTPSYQVSQVQRGNIVVSVSASGQVVSTRNLAVTTQASGVVSNVYVKNGDSVDQNQPIADLLPDTTTLQKQAAAWSSYLSAKNSLDSANNSLNTLQNTLFTVNQKFISDAVTRGLATSDPTYIEENATWLAAEGSYKNQQNVIAQAQSALQSANLSYQQTSSTITSPTKGIVSDLTITPGTVITSTSSSTSSTQTTTSKLASITIQGPIQVSVDLSEIDAPNVSIGQKVTITLDAFPNKTFSGKVVSIDTTGVVSSGVTTYPAVINLDSAPDNIYSNMSANASIITNVKNDVLTVPNAAIQTVNGQTEVRIMQNNQVQSIAVQTGLASDTSTEIVSGLSEGETVVTGVSTTSSSGTSSSVFGGGFRLGGGGGAARVSGVGGR